MLTLLIILLAIVLLAIIVGAGVWYWLKKHKSKNIERSLKMIPMLIKLPPQEADEGSKDIREAFKENASKAEGVFNLLSGMANKKDFISGEKYIVFEIIAKGPLIEYFAMVPVSLLSMVQKALSSGYPNIQIERIDDPNIFSDVSKIEGVDGGEMVLKEESHLPILTYKEQDSDAMAGIINSMSNLGENEGAAIQILIRPADSKWAKTSISNAEHILEKGSDSTKPGKLILGFIKDLLRAPFRSENSRDSDSENKGPTQIDQKKSELIMEKAKSPAYETVIRLIASSDNSQRAKLIINDMKIGFAQLAQGGSNRFTFEAAKNKEKFVTDFIFRFYPIRFKKDYLNSVELATLFHLPSEELGLAVNLKREAAKEVAAPPGLPTSGIRIGKNIFRGTETPIYLTVPDKRRHVYIIGQTGTGKSTVMINMLLQDVMQGGGICFIDPNGDEAEKLLGRIPKERLDDVIYFSPGDMQYPLGFNIMEYPEENPELKDFLIQEAILMIKKIYDPNNQGFVGPMFDNWFRNAALTVMSDPDGGTFVEIPKLFTDDEFLKKKFKHLKDERVQDFWTGEYAQTDQRSKSDMLGYFVSKFGAITNNEMLRNILGQKRSAFNFREIMDNRKILIVNLSKGLMGEVNAKLIGMMFVIKLQMAAMSRANIDEKDRVDFSLYVDEFQNIATDSFATILSEARKYRFSLTVANQYIEQIDEQIRDAVYGNVGSMIIHRISNEDSEYMEKIFKPQFSASDISNIPNHFAVAKIIANGKPVTPFSMQGYPPIDNEVIDKQRMEEARNLSRQKYASPKDEVVKEINRSLSNEPKDESALDAVDVGAKSSGNTMG